MTLHDVNDSPEVQSYRQDSLTGNLPCFQGCNFIRKSLLPPRSLTSPNIDYSELSRLDILFGDACNISCIMCHQAAKTPRNPEILDPAILMDHVDVTPFDDIILQGGEPLFIPECIEYMGSLERMNKKYSILSNGLLILDDMVDRLADHAQRVIISLNAATTETHARINAGSSFETVLQNIRNLKLARDRAHTTLTIIGRMTLVPQNLHEIPDYILRYQEFGCDSINFGYDKATVPTYIERNPAFKEQLINGISKSLRNADGSTIDLLRLEQLGLIRYDESQEKEM